MTRAEYSDLVREAMYLADKSDGKSVEKYVGILSDTLKAVEEEGGFDG